ncbi:MAG: hypothetical protein KJ674_00220 [Nanoarchaeota archaeon]|nr:hypothetical protein [Nanoarchaeota archaeon]
MVNEQAIIEAFARIKEEFQELRNEITDLKGKLDEINSFNNHTEIIEEEIQIPQPKKIVEEEIDLSDSYY